MGVCTVEHCFRKSFIKDRRYKYIYIHIYIYIYSLYTRMHSSVDKCCCLRLRGIAIFYNIKWVSKKKHSQAFLMLDKCVVLTVIK